MKELEEFVAAEWNDVEKKNGSTERKKRTAGKQGLQSKTKAPPPPPPPPPRSTSSSQPSIESPFMLSSKEAWKLLQTLGFKYAGGKYHFPNLAPKDRVDGENTFRDIPELAHNIHETEILSDARCKSKISGDEMKELEEFVAAEWNDVEKKNGSTKRGRCTSDRSAATGRECAAEVEDFRKTNLNETTAGAGTSSTPATIKRKVGKKGRQTKIQAPPPPSTSSSQSSVELLKARYLPVEVTATEVSASQYSTKICAIFRTM